MSYEHKDRRERRVGPYRSRQGIVFGVCRGMADHLDIPVFWVRAGVIVAFFFTAMWPVGITYIVMGLLMKPEPVLPLESDADAEFYNCYASSRGLALQRLKRTFDNLDRRIQRIEGIVTSPGFDWDQRLEEDR